MVRASNGAALNTVTPAELGARLDEAAAYRLATLYGYDDLFGAHSVRVSTAPGVPEAFPINPYGMPFDRSRAGARHTGRGFGGSGCA
jgi:hypothetical protein